MQSRRTRPTVRILVAAAISGLLALLSVAATMASNGPGPWP